MKREQRGLEVTKVTCDMKVERDWRAQRGREVEEWGRNNKNFI